MNITLHIDRLVLEGFSLSAQERQLLETAVSAELTRLLAVNGLGEQWMTGTAVSAIRASSIQLTNQNTPVQLGSQIAQAVYRELGQGSEK